ncbi:hypothetical protein [Pseudomonas marginalis]|uniref:hypothetical protein n=1 Tax=Pseudomonas marginalis TaxID=298 RepID=UPI0034D4012C
MGHLETLTLPDQRQLNHLFYGSGHMHQLNLDGRVISDFERDALHEEVLRTQGALHYRSATREELPLQQKTTNTMPATPDH